MKTKITSLVCAIALVFSLFPLAEAKAPASDQEAPLYIYSKECPDSYAAYALNTAGEILGSSEYAEITNPYIGTPFTFANTESDIYYFPIFSDGKIVYTFRVYMTYKGDLAGIMSEALTDDLNEFTAQTSLNNPLKIYCEDDHVIFLQEDSAATFSSEENTDQKSDFSVIECKAENQIEKTIQPRQGDSYIDLYANFYYVEVQPMDSNWCVGYVASAITSYLGIYLTPKMFMKKYGVTDPKIGTNIKNLYNYLNDGYNSCTAKYSSSPLSFLDMAVEIQEGRPVAIAMKNLHPLSDKEYNSHALIVRGLDSYRANFSIWNPWYKFYESVTTLDSYTPALHTAREFSYTQDGRTVYGIKNLA